MAILFVQTFSAKPFKSNQFKDIDGLTLELPPTSTGNTHALAILNVPEPYAEGDNFPGIFFAIAVDQQVVAQGGFTYSQERPAAFGRMPFTLVVRVPLPFGNPVELSAQWQSVRDSMCHIDSFASLSAITGTSV